ncbi:PepSY-associated TM helix domain-containing protein [Pseudoalteromonas fuliginea]|uniref:PepSY domain-containing protein n=1 Tax=Pseudoalteromonas fuliginea TaxID=1872678 RepID=A0ABQ6RND8_9GAMM|nr:PepSY domain-containing protein [Pseudoalteromonas fuliginea]KAA1165828.1 PepSY domain-containing protein [Pseudoalteromonas fuliginea]KAA1169679.1 PepSY domain-containing protein [Pseudoalteromonas fuliginea]
MLPKLSWQKIFRRLHLYLGLSIGFLLTVIALSGSVLIYYPQIDSQLNLTKVNIKHTDKVDWDLAYKNLKTAFPDKYGPWRLEVTDDNSIIPARYYNPVETQNREFATLMIWLSNDKYKVIRKDYWGDYFVTWLYNLHFSLLTGSTGIIIVGYIGIATLTLLISGLLAWWPKKGQWIKSLKFKRRSSKIGLLYDWHKLIGLSLCIPLLALTITGIMLAIPKQTDPILIALVSDINSPLKTQIQPSKQSNIPLSQAILIAKKALPSARLAWIETPSNLNAIYRFRFQTVNDPSYRFPHSYIEVNALTGKLESMFNIDKQSTASKIKNWIHPLHDGSIGGNILKVIWLLSGFGSAALFFIGIYRWLIRTKRI